MAQAICVTYNPDLENVNLVRLSSSYRVHCAHFEYTEMADYIIWNQSSVNGNIAWMSYTPSIRQ